MSAGFDSPMTASGCCSCRDERQLSDVITPEQRSYMNRRACDVGLSILAQERRGLNSWKRVDLFVVKWICQPGALRQLLSQG